MSSRLSHEVAKLARESRHKRIHDQETIRGLTLVIGYGLLVESNPEYCPFLRRHLESFITVACVHGYPELCERSRKIQNIVDEMEMTEQNVA